VSERQMRRRIIRLFCQGHITEFSMRAAIILLDVNGVESAAEYVDWAIQRARVTQDAPLFASVKE